MDVELETPRELAAALRALARKTRDEADRIDQAADCVAKRPGRKRGSKIGFYGPKPRQSNRQTMRQVAAAVPRLPDLR